MSQILTLAAQAQASRHGKALTRLRYQFLKFVAKVRQALVLWKMPHKGLPVRFPIHDALGIFGRPLIVPAAEFIDRGAEVQALPIAERDRPGGRL